MGEERSQGASRSGAPVKLMISLMYRPPMQQITGGPGWLNIDLYDMEANADHSYSFHGLPVMFRDVSESGGGSVQAEIPQRNQRRRGVCSDSR
jgi:hypothetical protein